MSCSAFRDRPGHCWLRPVGGFEVENDEIGEVGSVFVLPAENEQLVALVQRGSMA